MRKYRKRQMVCENNNLPCDVQTASAVSPPAVDGHCRLPREAPAEENAGSPEKGRRGPPLRRRRPALAQRIITSRHHAALALEVAEHRERISRCDLHAAAILEGTQRRLDGAQLVGLLGMLLEVVVERPHR
jgi:hypothetical protein